MVKSSRIQDFPQRASLLLLLPTALGILNYILDTVCGALDSLYVEYRNIACSIMV